MQDRSPLPFVLMALVAAALVATNQFRTQSSTAAETLSSDRTVRQKSAPSPPQISAPQCDGSVPLPLRPLCLALYDPNESSPPPAVDWRKREWVQRAKGRVQFVVTAVADPDESGDALRFDRTVDALQSAAEGLGYSFTHYWIPWQEERAPSGETAPVIQEPGSLLFRDADSLLVVFLVGESPVSGVRQFQFLNAVSHIEALSSQKLLIVGPNYSGSLAALRALIDSAGGKKTREAQVISPSVTVLRAAESFSSDPRIEFWSMVHNDTYATARFNQYVARRWSLPPGDLAVVRESTTVFGQAASQQSDGPQTMVQFPRGIFRLRNAAPEATARGLFAPEQTPVAQDTRLSMSLRGPRPGQDRVPSLGPSQAAVTQEAVLLGIASALRQRGSRFAQIVASDAYDTAFVAGFLKRAYPKLRPYFLNADLLNVKAAQLLPLEGSLSVTTFPLIPQNQVWSRPSSSAGAIDLAPVSSRLELGVYNALRALLLLQRQDARQEELREYFFPNTSFQDRPPLWLTVVGANGYWPVALLDRDYHGKADPILLSWPVKPGNQIVWPSLGEPSWLWIVAWSVLILGGLVLVVVVVKERLWKDQSAAAGPLSRGNTVPSDQRDASGIAFSGLSACLVTAAMVFTMWGPVYAASFHSRTGARPTSWALIGAVAFCYLTAAAVLLFVRLMRRPQQDVGSALFKTCGWLSLAGFAFFIALWSVSMKTGEGLEGFFFCYRSMDVLNGVNPVMPFLFLGTGLLVLIRLHRTCHVAEVEFAQRLSHPALKHERGTLASPSFDWDTARLIVAGMVTILIMPVREPQQTLEGRWYGVLHLVTLVVFYALVVFAWARFLAVWMHLKPLLDGLATSPLRAEFEKLPRGTAPCSILRGECRSAWPSLYLSGDPLLGQLTPRQYAWFVGRVMLQLRSLLFSVAIGFFLGLASTLVYPFRTQEAFAWAGTVNLVLLGLPVIAAIMQIERHPMLAPPEGGKTSGVFGGVLVKLALYFALPLAAVIGSHYPALGRSLLTLLQPAAQLMR